MAPGPMIRGMPGSKTNKPKRPSMTRLSTPAISGMMGFLGDNEQKIFTP